MHEARQDVLHQSPVPVLLNQGGLGQDVSLGCAAVAEHGGFVWTQSPESCVIAGMPEATRRSSDVVLSGAPEQLAQALAARCRSESVNIN